MAQLHNSKAESESLWHQICLQFNMCCCSQSLFLLYSLSVVLKERKSKNDYLALGKRHLESRMDRRASLGAKALSGDCTKMYEPRHDVTGSSFEARCGHRAGRCHLGGDWLENGQRSLAWAQLKSLKTALHLIIRNFKPWYNSNRRAAEESFQLLWMREICYRDKKNMFLYQAVDLFCFSCSKSEVVI